MLDGLVFVDYILGSLLPWQRTQTHVYREGLEAANHLSMINTRRPR